MKCRYLILSILFITNNINAQKLKKHEFGIGAGYLEYSNQSYGPIPNEWKQQFAFTSFDSGNFYFVDELYSTNVTIPTCYYSYNIGKRIQARISYQLSFAKGILNTPIGINPPYYQRITSNIKCHEIEIGYFYTFMQKKRCSIATGLGFNAYTVSSRTTYQYEGGNKQTIKDSNGKYRLFSSLSTTIPLCTKINLKYDLSLLTDLSAFFYRPINRLSVNYCF